MAKKTKEQIDKEVEEQIALVLQGYDPRLAADLSKEDFELPDDTNLALYDIGNQAEKNNRKKYRNDEALVLQGYDPNFLAFPAVEIPEFPPRDPASDERAEALMEEQGFGPSGFVKSVVRAKNVDPNEVEYYGQPLDTLFHDHALPGVKAFGTRVPVDPIPNQGGFTGKLSHPVRQDVDISLVKGGPYPYRNELPEDKPEAPKKEDPVAKKVKEVNDEIRRIEVANDTKIQADYKALARKQDALWQYAVYRAANGDTSLFDKLVGDAEARREAERNREFQAAEAEKNRQSAERQSASTRSEADRSEFVSAKKKAERALQDLNDINDSTRAKWANGSATSDDVLNLRRAYRAYQYALDDAEAAARKISEAYDSGDIFDKTTGDLGINLDAMKGLNFNDVYTGERNLPYTATMASNVVGSKQISDALNSADPEKAKESSLMLGDELEKFNTNHPSNMGLEEIQRIQNLFQDKIDQLNAVTAPTTNQKRRTALNKSAENEQLAWEELQPKLNRETDSAKKQQMVDKHNRTYGSNRTLIKPRKNK